MPDKSSSSDNLPGIRSQPSHKPGGLAIHLGTSIKRGGEAKFGGSNPPAAGGLRNFNLKEIGIDQDQFIRAISSSFDSLPLDNYEQRQQQIAYLFEKFPSEREKVVRFSSDFICGRTTLRPLADVLAKLSPRDLHEFEHMATFQRRAIAKFEAIFRISKFPAIRRVAAGNDNWKSSLCHYLSVLPISYPEISEKVTDHSATKQLCRFAALLAKGLNKNIFGLTLTIHQVSELVQKNQSAPDKEMIDQHGVDYVVPAIPIILENVSVPINTLYDLQEKAVYKTRLKVGDGLFLDDRAYRQSISPPRTTFDFGRRCILSLDIQATAFEEEQ